MTTEKLEPPRQSKGDTVHAIAKAGLSAIPVVGGPAVELFQMLIQPPLERRREEWMASIGEKLQELENRGVDIAQIGQREEFVSAVMHASQIALRTHQAEKREALRNAVFNIASGQSPGEALEHMFFDWIESMSVLHIQILRLFQNPKPPPGLSMGGLDSVLEHNMPALRGHGNVYRQIWRDLYSRGLLNTNSVETAMSAQGLAAKRTTDIGDELLRFIAEPAL
jgi:hypothetical protein